LAKPALEVVNDGRVKLHPQKFANTYRHWMENVRDWCISRQLWWGQRVPAWFAPKSLSGKIEFDSENPVVCKTREEAIEVFTRRYIQQGVPEDVARKSADAYVHQDADVVDTWFSSWLWPISVFDGFKDPDNADIKYYYPTNDLVTAPEILFFWVARMIMAGMEYKQEVPFKNVYLTGIVRDKQGRKMSKSLGNSPDPLELIEKFGADGVRVGMLLTSPAGNDLPYDDSLCEQGRNFSNKIWNAFRLVKGWSVDDRPQPASSAAAVAWMQSRVARGTTEIDQLFAQFRISEALMATYKLVWDDLCSWYLESVKTGFVKNEAGEGVAEPIDRQTYEATVAIFEEVMKLLHPFMPFLSEEVWHLLRDRKEGEDIIIAPWPKGGGGDAVLEERMSHVFALVTAVRNKRNERSISPKEPLKVYRQSDARIGDAEADLVYKLSNAETLEFESTQSREGLIEFLVTTVKYHIDLGGNIDVDAEVKKAEAELNHLRGFLASVEKKLGNERFVTGAPAAVLETERKKKADAEAKIAALEARLGQLTT
jgi:valyl-tRNA synthetase